jgi:hypothetical protein
MFRIRLSTLVLCCVALFTAMAAGCSRGRLVYSQSRGEVVSSMSAADLKNTAAELGETMVTEGETWRLLSESSSSVRVSHTQPRHLTYIDIYFYNHDGGSTFSAAGYSKASGSFWTGGITSAATQGVAKPKIKEFITELERLSGAE